MKTSGEIDHSVRGSLQRAMPIADAALPLSVEVAKTLGQTRLEFFLTRATETVMILHAGLGPPSDSHKQEFMSIMSSMYDAVLETEESFPNFMSFHSQCQNEDLNNAISERSGSTQN